MAAQPDPYAVLGVTRGADATVIHAAYRKAVRRTHPDAGGSASAFQEVQQAYEALRDPAGRPGAGDPPRPAPPRPRAADPGFSDRSMDDLLAESRRIEDDARRLAGLPPRHSEATGEAEDSLGAILRDAGQQLRGVADAGTRELRRRARRYL